MIKYTFEKKFYIVSEVKASPSKFFQEYTIFMRTRFLNGADFGSMLRNLQLSIFSAATQLGIFTVLLVAILMGFTSREAASLGIIGGASGPIAIFTTIKQVPHLPGLITIAAYSYMALVPVIVPLVVKIWCTKKEFSINMKEQEKYPSKTEIKNLRVFKIVFSIVVTAVMALFVFMKKKITPLIGATGLSTVSMTSRVVNEITLLQYCMANNIWGVIGLAVAADMLISLLG